jgi:glycosyltransferase involved in cell wall biosynthesis
MRVAFDVAPVREQPTGVGVFVSSMAHALAGELPAADLALIGKHDSAVDLPEQARSTRFSGRGYIAWVQLRAEADVKRLGADIGHFTDGVSPLVRHGTTVVSIHDMSVVRAWRTHPARRRLRIPFALAAPHLADLIIVPSRSTADEVFRLSRVSHRKVEVVPYAPRRGMVPADDPTVQRVLGHHGLTRHTYILALGTIEPRKNHIRLVQAFEIAVRSNAIPPDMQLVIAGNAGWHARPILERIGHSTVTGRIHRLGYVPAQDLGPLLTGAAAVAYPSLYEGFGLPVIEAMACGAATVTSTISSMPEVAGDAGFLVDPYDPHDIARGLVEAIRANQSDRSSTSAAAVSRAGEFTWERTAKAVIDLYRRNRSK